MDIVRRLQIAVMAVLSVLVAGTVGYVLLGLGPLDALYQTVTTVTTVGFRELFHLDTAAKVFTIALILFGTGTMLYTFTLLLEALVEGHLRHRLERRRMERDISRMTGHVIICGWGRVGRSVAAYLAGMGQDVVVVDRDAERLASCPHPSYVGDVTDDGVLRTVGVLAASVLVAAIDTDADNVYVTLSARALRPDLVIIARARNEDSEAKLLRAGATRVVNPQRIGGQRIAAAAVQPHVVQFLDVVMHDGSLEFRLEEVPVTAGSPLAGRTVGETDLRESTGALLLALHTPTGGFTTNPPLETVIEPGSVLIAVGTQLQLAALHRVAGTVSAVG